MRDTGGAGSFFSMVDITPTEHHLHLVRGVLAKPGLVTWTNNALDWSHMTDFVDEMSGSTEACAARMGTRGATFFVGGQQRRRAPRRQITR